MKFAFYCTCGASGTGSVKPDAKVVMLHDIFWRHGSGPEHQPCDQKTAAKARAKAERREVKAAR